MAAKKKTAKKSAASKKAAGKKMPPTKKKTGKAPKKLQKRKATPKKAVAKKKVLAGKTIGHQKSGVSKKKMPVAAKKKAKKKSQRPGPPAFSRERTTARSGEQAGDLQGLSDIASADSESVDELVEEGNAFEAGVVAGVEDSEEGGVREVRTREVPEDDVPAEYLDEE
jgi:hypothetical protein